MSSVVSAIAYVRWDYIALCVAMAIVFGLEMLGVFGKHYITITEITVTYLPAWARAMILGWLGYHFLIQYK